jgi:hypothetical protein
MITMYETDGLSVKQERLITYLLTERTIDAACAKAEVAVTTYWRWMKDPLFLTQYRTARDGILENTIAKLQSLSFEAIDTLERNLNCGNPSVEIRCATIILEQSIKGMEMLSLKTRVEQIENEMKEQENEQFKSQG